MTKDMIQSKIQEKQVYLHFYENFSAISAVYIRDILSVC